jgi:hypothetical protein
MGENIGSDFKVKRGNSLRNSPWVVSTFILGILVLILLVGSFSGMTGKTISGSKAGENLVNFAVSQGVEAELVNVTSEGSFYKVFISVNGQEAPYLITKDGKSFLSESYLVPLTVIEEVIPSNTNTPAVTEIPKSVKPSVELYVFTYCPYGTQAEKGIIPVADLLGNKIDFKIRQIGAMHGEYEKIEAQRQLCIEKNYPTKYLDYILAFALSSEVGACNGDATCVGPKIDALYTKLGISKTKINSCMTGDGVTMYNSEVSNSQNQGVSGSPTLIVNGVKASSARDSASYLKVICGAFSEGNVPSECSEKLSSASPSPGFGSTTSGASSSAQC